MLNAIYYILDSVWRITTTAAATYVWTRKTVGGSDHDLLHTCRHQAKYRARVSLSCALSQEWMPVRVPVSTDQHRLLFLWSDPADST